MNGTLHQIRSLVPQLVQFLEEQKVSHFCTLSFHRTVTLGVAERKLKTFFARVDRLLLGRYWAKQKDKRMFAVAMPENINENIHYHAMVRVASEHTKTFIAIANQIWRDVTVAGDVNIQPVDNIPRRINYMIKNSNREPVIENMVISTQFHALGVA